MKLNKIRADSFTTKRKEYRSSIIGNPVKDKWIWSDLEKRLKQQIREAGPDKSIDLSNLTKNIANY